MDEGTIVTHASYVGVARDHLPWALMELHHATSAGTPVHLTVQRGDPDRGWGPDVLRDVLVGAGFGDVTIADDPDADPHADPHADGGQHAFAVRLRSLPDTVGPGMRLLVCGLNPSGYAADAGVGFARPGNRFWPAALAAGVVTRDRDARHALVGHGVGMTDLVKRATARADELDADEYEEGAARVERLVRWLRPGAVCFVGLGGYRVAVDRTAVAGPQPERFGGAPTYVMPNTSGLNARVPLAELTGHLRRAADLGA